MTQGQRLATSREVKMLNALRYCSVRPCPPRQQSSLLSSFSRTWWRRPTTPGHGYRLPWLENVSKCPRRLMSGATSLSCEVENEGKTMKVTWADGGSTAFHAVWLRHNCQCPNCVSIQLKTIRASTLDPHVTVTSTSLSGLFSITT